MAICQTDTLSFKLSVEKDSSLNFSTKNKDLINYLDSQIDISLERGFYPREKVIVRCIISDNATLDSIILISSHNDLKLEISDALNKIDKLYLPKQYDLSQIELLLIIKRWKEAGEFSITGRIVTLDN